MAVLKPRNKILIFRLTEEEYSDLQSACSVVGARSLSDFARSRLLGAIQTEPPSPALVNVTQQLTELQTQLRTVVERLDNRSAK